jgi:hypothetical protein
MGDHRADFIEIKGFIDKAINACLDGLFEERVPSF